MAGRIAVSDFVPIEQTEINLAGLLLAEASPQSAYATQPIAVKLGRA
jgi:hypothetical protein